MKKILALIMILATAFALCGCGNTDTQQNNVSGNTTANVDYSFTNIYGTKDTVCADPECEEHIAYKGETAFCANHSYMCPVCYTFIMPDQSTCSNPDCIEASKTLENFTTTENCVFRVIKDKTNVAEVAHCNDECAESANLCIKHATYMKPALTAYEAGLEAAFNNNKAAFDAPVSNDSDQTCQFVIGDQNICGDSCAKASNFCEYHTAIMDNIYTSLTGK